MILLYIFEIYCKSYLRKRDTVLDSLMIKAERFMQIGDYENAKKLYLEILNNEPENAKAYNKLGVISAREGNLQEAKHRFLKALELNPRLSSAASNLGNIYFEADDLKKAEEFYKKAISLNPDNPVPYNNMAVIYKKQTIDEYVKYYKIYSALCT